MQEYLIVKKDNKIVEKAIFSGDTEKGIAIYKQYMADRFGSLTYTVHNAGNAFNAMPINEQKREELWTSNS